MSIGGYIVPSNYYGGAAHGLDLAIQQINVLYLDFYFCFAFPLSVSLSISTCAKAAVTLVLADKKYHFGGKTRLNKL